MAKEYSVNKTAGQCCNCEKQLEVGVEFVATLKEASEEFLREDFCLSCWENHKDNCQPGMLGFWHSKVAQPQEKKKLFVDNELLINFFERLDGSEEPAKINFRFVLALILMRKKLLVYEGSSKMDDGRDTWTMHLKGSEEKHQVIDPKMDDEKISQVSEQLSEILEGEF